MQPDDRIVLNEFCVSHRLEVSFIKVLEEHGLVEIIAEDQELFIPNDELPRLERMVRLHQELNINPEGLDAIDHLLKRIDALQKNMTELSNRLSFYEGE
jgi:hypothetical protein